jgi:hypothetical protein
MFSDAELTLTYNVANASIRFFPYPHIYVEDVFPRDFYAEIQRNIPDPSAMIPIEQARPVKGYKERFVLDIAGDHVHTLPGIQKEFWKDFSGWLLSGRFMNFMMQKFSPFLQQRFKDAQGLRFNNECMLVEDITKYALGPHTDSPRKVLTFLFYLPKDDSQSHLGTSIYVPRDGTFTCPGGPHYPFDKFQRVTTMPFKPNALFAFVKTKNSFHGVEPLTNVDTKRWLLLYDIYIRQSAQQPLYEPQTVRSHVHPPSP